MKNFDRGQGGVDLNSPDSQVEQESARQIKKVIESLKGYIHNFCNPDEGSLEVFNSSYSDNDGRVENRIDLAIDPIKKIVRTLQEYKDQATEESLQEIEGLLQEIAAFRLKGMILDKQNSRLKRYSASELVEVLKNLDNPEDFFANNKNDANKFFDRIGWEMSYIPKDGNEQIFLSYIELLKYSKYFIHDKQLFQTELSAVIDRWISLGMIKEIGSLIKNSKLTLDDFQEEISLLIGGSVFDDNSVLTEKYLGDIFGISSSKVEEFIIDYISKSHVSGDSFKVFLDNALKNEFSPSLLKQLDKIFSQRIKDDDILIYNNQGEFYKTKFQNEIFQNSLPLTSVVIFDIFAKQDLLADLRNNGDIFPDTPAFVSSFLATDNLPLVSSIKKALTDKSVSEIVFFGEEGKNNPAKETLELSSESKEFLESMRESIKKAHEYYLSTIKNSDYIPEDEKKCLAGETDGEISMNNMLKNIEGLTARLVVETTRNTRKLEDSLRYLSEELDDYLYDSIDAFEAVYQVDIPLYNKLYAEFDAVRNSDRKPMEVYLGRDGIYAHIGRRAQEAGRLSTPGLSEDEYKNLEIHPKYMVYPSFFRDKMSYDAKKEFLKQEGISVDSDPLFYDTGYTGTIPEQIMKIMNFTEEEIRERIRMLSADKSERRLKALDGSESDDIVNMIEDNSKTVESAMGLYRDHKGKIRPIEFPTSPAERMRFAFIKQAIARHYWFTEKKRGFKPHKEIDSKTHKMFLDQKVASDVPADFLKRPEFYLNDLDAKEIKPVFGKGDRNLFVVEMPSSSTKEAQDQFVDATVKRNPAKIIHLQEGYAIKGYKIVGLVLDKNEGNKTPKHFLLFQSEESVAENQALQKAA